MVRIFAGTIPLPITPALQAYLKQVIGYDQDPEAYHSRNDKEDYHDCTQQGRCHDLMSRSFKTPLSQ